MEDSRSTLAHLLDPLDRHGDRTALLRVGAEDVERVSHGELARRVARQAAGLRKQGIEPGESVVLFARAGLEWIEACLAILRARAVPVPLDTQLESESLERILEDCGAHWIVSDPRSVERLGPIDSDVEIVLLDAAPDARPDPASDAAQEEGEHEATKADREGGTDAGTEERRGGRRARWQDWACDPQGLPERPEPEDRAILFYTSGTTGPPKGVPLAHHALAYQIEVLREAELVRDDDRLLLPLPLHHVYPLVVGLFAPLALGLTVVLPDGLTGARLLRALQVGEATALIAVPRVLEALVDGLEQRIASRGVVLATALRGVIRVCTGARRRLGLDLARVGLRPLRARVGSRLRLLVSGGSALSPELAWKLRGLGFELASGYGLTETAPLLAINPPDSPELGSVGRPVRGVEVRIDREAHPEHDASAEQGARSDHDAAEGGAGVEGEILVRGPGVFEGYLDLEEETRSSFTQDGWFRTGDLGWLDEQGFLFVTGRKGTLLLSSSGEKIRTEEVEERYAGDPWIAEIGVLRDEEEGVLAAVVVPDRAAIREQAGELETDEAIGQALGRVGRELPSHQRIERWVVSRSPLERTRLGKIRRHRLEGRYARLREGGGEPERTRAMAIEEMAPADRELLAQEEVRRVWTLLAERFGDRGLTPDSDLELDLGLDSLGWLDLGLEITERTGVELEEEHIRELDRVRDLLEAVSRTSSRPEAEAKAPIERPEAVLDAEQQRWLDPLPDPAARCARVVSRVNRALVRRLLRLEVEGDGHLPREGPAVIAPNHTSYLDPPVLAAALPEPIRERSFWGGWTGIAFKNRFFRAGSRLMRAVPVDPDRATVSSLAFAAAVLERRGHLVWFPEGRRSPDGRLLGLRAGLGRLLERRDDVVVIPVHIEGTHALWPVGLWPAGRRRPRLRRVRVRFGAPERPADLARQGEGEGEGEARSDRITDGLHAALGALADSHAERPGREGAEREA